MAQNDELKIVGSVEIKCPECGGEIFSTPMPIGKINYFPGRSMISNRPDIEIRDAEMACICVACKTFVSLGEMKAVAREEQDGETEKPENSEGQKET